MLRRLIHAAIALALMAPAFGADLPPRPKEGFGVFLVVLGQSYASADGNTKPLDLADFEGVLHERREQVLIATLPLKAWSRVEAAPGVAYVQRVWMGEPLEGWTAHREGPSPRKLRPTTHGARPEALRDAPLAPASWDSNIYTYDGSGNITGIGADTYSYDSAGRVIQASVGNVPEQYAYDAFGNLTAKSTNARPSPIPAIDTGSNRLIGYPYDVAGNVTTLPGAGGSWEYAATYTYDALGMPVSVTGHTGDRQPRRMIYTADDERLAVMQGWTTAKITIRGLDAKVLREFRGNLLSSGWEWAQDYVWADGQLVAGERESHNGGRLHFHLDHLGSVRLITRADRTRLSEHHYFPFGVERTDSTAEVRNFEIVNNRIEPMKFTSHERDFLGFANVDGADHLDYMHARYYDANLGRFLSVDPTWESADLSRPQSWNRYAYVENNPIRRIDPDGRAAVELLWNRLKHVINRHVNKDEYPHKSKFATNNPRDVQKLTEKTVKPENLVKTQRDGRKVYEKTFNKVVGTAGEKTVRAVTEPVRPGTEKVITSTPTLNTLASFVNALGLANTALTIFSYSRDFVKEHGRGPSFDETSRFLMTGDSRSNDEVMIDALKSDT